MNTNLFNTKKLNRVVVDVEAMVAHRTLSMIYDNTILTTIVFRVKLHDNTAIYPSILLLYNVTESLKVKKLFIKK